MKLGLYIPDCAWVGGPARLGATLGEIARTADACGFDAIGVPDHVWQHPYMGGAERAMLECYATLSFIAANTSRARLIGVVSPVHFRYPGLLAKTVIASVKDVDRIRPLEVLGREVIPAIADL